MTQTSRRMSASIPGNVINPTTFNGSPYLEFKDKFDGWEFISNDGWRDRYLTSSQGIPSYFAKNT